MLDRTTGHLRRIMDPVLILGAVLLTSPSPSSATWPSRLRLWTGRCFVGEVDSKLSIVSSHLQKPFFSPSLIHSIKLLQNG